jgi:hypothetical protein
MKTSPLSPTALVLELVAKLPTELRMIIAAAVGFATAGSNETTQAIHQEVQAEAEAMADGAQPLDDDEAKARVHAARERGLRRTGKALHEGLRAQERQRRRRIKGAETNRTRAAAEHAKWLAAFDACARRNPGALKNKIVGMVANQFGVSASSVRRVVRDR